MAYLVGATTVIDNSGNIDWARLTNVPTIGDITGVTVSNGTPVDGAYPYLMELYSTRSQIRTAASAAVGSALGNCNCTENCYTVSLSGGGTTGAVTVTANREYFNCNCNCNCRC